MDLRIDIPEDSWAEGINLCDSQVFQICSMRTAVYLISYGPIKIKLSIPVI